MGNMYYRDRITHQRQNVSFPIIFCLDIVDAGLSFNMRKIYYRDSIRHHQQKVYYVNVLSFPINFSLDTVGGDLSFKMIACLPPVLLGSYNQIQHLTSFHHLMK